MRRTILLLASMALAVLLTYAASGSVPTAGAQTSPAKPNIVFILADDMRKDDLRYMPKTRSLLGGKGMTFSNAYVSNAMCCPSRASILRGQYSHNSGVWTNGGPNGGWDAFKMSGGEQDNLATRLHEAGYSTAMIGKYMNNYEGTGKPSGWSKWFATYYAAYFDYDVNDNGFIRHFGTKEGDYLTDQLRWETREFIGASTAAGKPFFAYVAPSAPHYPATAAPRDLHTYDGVKAPRPPSFNEKDVSDKPPWIRALPRLTSNQIAEIDRRQEKRAETLQALDDLVEGTINKLEGDGILWNTYIVFTSDNGHFSGEHRIPNNKGRPYEEDSRVPLLIRGPGVAPSSTSSHLVLNTDYLPTFTDLAGTITPDYADGRSLQPLITGQTPPPTWRTAILMEGLQGEGAYYGIRTASGRKYIEYEGDVRELYNLGADPYELVNSYNPSAPPADLALRLQSLKSCASTSCHVAENGQ